MTDEIASYRFGGTVVEVRTVEGDEVSFLGRIVERPHDPGFVSSVVFLWAGVGEENGSWWVDYAWCPSGFATVDVLDLPWTDSFFVYARTLSPPVLPFTAAAFARWLADFDDEDLDVIRSAVFEGAG